MSIHLPLSTSSGAEPPQDVDLGPADHHLAALTYGRIRTHNRRALGRPPGQVQQQTRGQAIDALE